MIPLKEKSSQAKHHRSESAHSREFGQNYCRVWGVIPLKEKSSQSGGKLNLCGAMAILILFAQRKAKSIFTDKIFQENWLAHNTSNFLLM